MSSLLSAQAPVRRRRLGPLAPRSAALVLLSVAAVLLLLATTTLASSRGYDEEEMHEQPMELDAHAYRPSAADLEEFHPIDFDLDRDETSTSWELEQEEHHDPTAFLELHADLEAESDLGADMLDDAPQQTQTQHIEHLLALQDKYTTPLTSASVPAPEAEEEHALVETQQQSSAASGVGLSVGASAEVQAAIAAGVDMSSESQMEAQLESLAAAQQSTEAKASQSAAAEQTANLLSFFWGNTPHKVWHDKDSWKADARRTAQASAPGAYIHPHKFEYLKAKKQVPVDATLPADQQPTPSKRGGKLPAPKTPATSSTKKTPAYREFAKHTANGRARYVHNAGAAPVKKRVQIKASQRLAPPAIGQREVFWLSLGKKEFAYNGAAGKSYPFNKIADAKAACLAVGADLASRSQLESAYQAGAEWCACGALAETAWGFPMQRKVAGCGTGAGTNEVCQAGGATCYGYKPTRESLRSLPEAAVAPFKPGQWNQDPFASLNEPCLHGAPWDTKKCLQKAWKIAGCSRRGTRFPSTQASTVLWNNMPDWPAVVSDMKNIALNDVTGGSTANQCKGPREVFFYTTGPKRFIWNGQAGDGYPFNQVKDAQAACESIGATLATKAQLEAAWRDGAEWCMCGALADSAQWSFPMHHALKGCGSKKGVIRTCSAGGATCFGVKPSQNKVKGISPFKPSQWHADRWTPLVKKCSHEPPYDLKECIQPAWKLAGCTKLGRDFPSNPKSTLVKQYSTMSWDSVREDILNRARTDPASCRSKFAVLDGACNHPPPYSSKRCLQKALTLAGCDEFGFIWPSSRSSSSSKSSKAPHKANLWWNTQKWSTVIQDIQNWAEADLVLKKDAYLGGCKGIQETFWYSGSTGVSYQFTEASQAAAACESIGSTLATPEQVEAAYKAGAEWCAAGFTTDGSARYPIQTPRKECSDKKGVFVWQDAKKAGANCFGFKPSPKAVTGLLPFHPKKRFSQVREWRVTPTTKCTRVCGSGKQERTVKCTSGGQVRPDHVCASIGPKPSHVAACNTAPCEYDFKKSAWTDCTKSCDSGEQTRTMRCIQTATGNEFPESKCLKLEEVKPRTKRQCNTHACVSYRWKLAPFATCSRECGGGVQTRKVLCLGSDKKIHPDERCTVANGDKPSTEQKCNTDVCPDWAWKVGKWNECSLSCGGGKTTRKVECRGSDGSIAKEERKCPLPKPESSKKCNTDACLLYSWTRGKWSQCTRTCGGGSSSRTVACADSLGKPAAEAACASQGPQPRTVKSCNIVPCRDFNWQEQRWSDCSLSCGGGTQTRKVNCVGDDGSLAKDEQCIPAGPKKDTKQACNTQKCATFKWEQTGAAVANKDGSLLEQNSMEAPIEVWSECSKQCGGGVQTREYKCTASDGSTRDAAACQAVLGSMPATKQPCNTQKCITFEFRPSTWSDCSLSCGGGLSSRRIPCVGSDGVEVAESKCLALGQTKEKTQKPCNTQSCEGFTWSVGAYSNCDASCGGGLQTRKVTCRGSSGKKYDDRHCASVGYDKPDSQRTCNTHRCVEKQWRIGSYDSCDRSCGGGETHRSVSCFGTDGKSYSDQDCLDSYLARNSSLTVATNVKPATSSRCNTQACVSYFWDVSDFSKCTQRCGGGLQSRDVVCKATDGLEKPDALCATLASKPASQQVCNTLTCPSYKLVISPWDTCSQSCGGGVQNRTATCISSRGVRITSEKLLNDLCPATPEMQQQCNPRPCATPDELGWVVKGWSKCDAECGGGVQRRLVLCKSQSDPLCTTFGDKPVSERACNTQQCTVYEWEKSEFGACSRSCGTGGVQRREVSCRGSDGSIHNPFSRCKDAGPVPSRTTECTQSPCVSFFWKASSWGVCSKQCGEGGIATRDVYCVGSDGAKRTDEACANQGVKPANTKECNTAACETHEFKIGEWESCTAGCGTGVQSREVQCRSTTTQKLVPLSKCLVGDAQPPVSQRECNTNPCITYYWQLGQFGECSNTCNGGFQTRAVSCLGSDGQTYKDDFCLTYSYKAPTQQICNTKPCGTFSWAPEPVWSSCSVSCDAGVQTRPIRCVGPDGNNWPQSTCTNSSLALGEKPREPAQECNTHACMTTMWDVTPWSKCTKHCGTGKQVRAVSCRKADGTRIPDRVCARLSKRPVETQSCNSDACPTYKWVADEFDDCSVSCGGGVMTRDVTCQNDRGSRVSNRHCYRLGLERPVPSEACNTAPCAKGASSWQIDPWQTCSAECGTGVRIRSVNCRPGANGTDSKCDSIQPAPAAAEPCNSHPCLTYRYEASRWGICSKSCDDSTTLEIRNSSSTATQSRTLRCAASDGTYSSLQRCATFLGSAELPATTRPCNRNPICKRYRWIFGKWTKCSRECGDKGNQHRAVYCSDEHNIKVQKSLCVFSGPKPYSSRRCNSHQCVREYEWKKGAWGDCSVPCGEKGGVQTRQVTCADRFGKNVTTQACELTAGGAPRTTKVCNQKKCVAYKWALKPWSKCSKWCGGGTQKREIACTGSDGKLTKDSFCTLTNGEKAEEERACNTVPCVAGHWKAAAEWSECTRSCGGGSRTRDVACVGADGSVLPDRACENDGVRPLSVAKCNEQKCLSTSWFIGTWSKCSVKCGGGRQQREVACIASDGVVKADINCQFAGAKAPEERDCNTYSCDSFVRQYTPFTDCTSSCGGGTQTRTQKCFNTASALLTKDEDCDHVPREELKRRCNTAPCLTYQWRIEPWTKCSKECGGGEKSRAVTCRGSDGTTVADSICALITAKPDVARSCHSSPCDPNALYGWKVADWSDCSHDCASGTKTRQVFCTRKSSGEQVAANLCLSKRPPTSTFCNTQKCAGNYWKATSDWSDCSVKCGGGIETRTVACVDQNGKSADAALCARSGSKPSSSQSCNTHACKKSRRKTDEEDSHAEKKREAADALREKNLTRRLRKAKAKKKAKLVDVYQMRKRRTIAMANAGADPSSGEVPQPKRFPPPPARSKVMRQDDIDTMWSTIVRSRADGELVKAMEIAAKEAQKANDLPERFDEKRADGTRRTAEEIHARKELRSAVTKARSRPNSPDSEDIQARYDRFDRNGKKRTKEEIAQRQSRRAHMRPRLSADEELKEIYDAFLPNGLPRPAADIVKRKAQRVAQAKKEEKANPLSEMYDAINPKTGKPRAPEQIAQRKLARAKQVAAKVQRQLTQSKLAQIDAERMRKKIDPVAVKYVPLEEANLKYVAPAGPSRPVLPPAEESKAVFDFIQPDGSPRKASEVRARKAARKAAEAAKEATDPLNPKFDKIHLATGEPRTPEDLAARKLKREQIATEKAAAALADLDKYLPNGLPRPALEVISRRAARRAEIEKLGLGCTAESRLAAAQKAGPAAVAAAEKLNKELSEDDEYTADGAARPAMDVILRKQQRTAADKACEAQLAAADSVDPKFNEPRTQSQIITLQRKRAARIREAQEELLHSAARAAHKEATATVDAYYAAQQAALDAHEAAEAKAQAAIDAELATRPLPPFEPDGSCLDKRGCKLPPEDDSLITPEQALKILPVVPQFKDVEKDEYEP